MSGLPAISGRELVRALEREGFEVVFTRGSHLSLRKVPFRAVVPLHDDLARGTLPGILKRAGPSKEDPARRLRS